MFDMIKARRESEKKEERYDLFSQLLDASQEGTEDGAAQMSDRELVGASTPAVSFLCTLMLYVGNIFVFLLAVSSICVHASFLHK
jgi:hypothetical protein